MQYSGKILISAVIPTYNEVESIPQLVKRLIPVLERIGKYEIIFINDGSTDGSTETLEGLQIQYSGKIKIIQLRKNCGKSTALQVGFNHAQGAYIVMLDADLQDTPEEIPKMLDYLEEHQLDVVTGWKIIRKDPVTKVLPSRLFNMIVRRFSGIKIHDFNCGLKLMRRECAKNLRLYSQLHRFMLVLLAGQGFKVGEVPVEHSPRQFGRSKFGGRRFYEGFLDIMTIFFLTRYNRSPLYFFGFYALLSFAISFLISAFYIPLHFISLHTGNIHGTLDKHPFWILSPVLLIVGILFVFVGLIGEMLAHSMPASTENFPIQKMSGFSELDNSERGPRRTAGLY